MKSANTNHYKLFDMLNWLKLVSKKKNDLLE